MKYSYSFLRKFICCSLVAAIFLLSLLHVAHAQLYTNVFTGVSACPTNGNVPTVATNATGTGLTRSTITCNSTANVFNSTTLNATASLSATSYIEFSVTANSGYQLNLTSLSFFRQASASAPNQLEVRYSTDGFASYTTWGAAPVSPVAGTVATWDFADFSTASGGTVTFRLYPYGTQRADLGGTSAASGTLRFDDVTVNGTVTAAAVPAIGVSSSAFTGFSYVLGSGPSAAQSFTLSATNLSAGGGTITISGSAGYEVSTTSTTSGFGASATLAYTGTGTLTSNTVWLRLKAALPAGAYNNQTISISGGGGSNSVTASGNVYSGTFTASNLAVETVGNGAVLSSDATVVSVREYTTAGAFANTYTQPNGSTSLPSSPPYYLTESGSATSAGQINLSANGAMLILPGYNALTGTASVVSTSTPANKRVIGVVRPNGTNTNNGFDFFSENNFRSIASNGYSYWAAGTVTAGAGLYYLKDLSATPVSLGSVNTRVVKIFNNKLYYATATTGGTGIYQVSTDGLPLTVNDVALTRLTDAAYAAGGSGGPSPYAFDINPSETVMYIADDATFVNTSTQKGGILKYTNSGGVWTYQYTLPSPAGGGARGIVVDWTTANPAIYFTTTVVTSNGNNYIAKIVDAGSTSTGATINAAIGTGYVFRGIQFSPVAITAAQLTCTANQLDFGGEPIGYTTPEKSFNVAGTGFTGNITVNAPVTSPTGQYGLSLTPGGPYTQSITITGGSPANATVYMVLKPTAVGTYNGSLTISAAGATNLLVPVTGKGINPVNYYNVPNADITLLANWGTNTNGTGTHPSNFTDDGQYFNITNTPLALASSASSVAIDQLATTASGSNVLTFTGVPTAVNSPQSLVVGAALSGTGIPAGTTITAISANTITMSANATVTDNAGTTISVAVSGPFTISGSLSKIIIGSSVNFIIPATRAYSGIADVAANGTLTLQNTSLPTFGTLDVASTVNYNQSGAATVSAETYGNLTLQGSALDSRTLPASGNVSFDLKVLGDFVANNVTVNAATVSPFTFMQLGGDFTMSNGAVMVAATPAATSGMLNVVTTGNSSQSFSYTGGGTIRMNTLTSTKSAGTLTLASNTTLLANGNQTPTSTYPGTILNFSGTAAFVSQAGSSLNATGVANINLNFTGNSTFTLGGNLNASDNSSASFSTPIIPTGSLVASFPSGTTFTDGGHDITVAGNLALGGAALAYNLTGNAVIATRTGTSNIGDAALTVAIVPHLNNFTFAPIGGTGTVFQPASGGTIYVDNDFNIGGTATGNKISAQGNTVKVGGNFADTRTVDMMAGATSVFEFNGSAAQTFSTAYTSGESFGSVKLNNVAGLTLTSGSLKASGNLNCTTGILTTGINKVILDVAANITETTSSYVLGNVQSTRTLTTGTAENFGGMGLTITAGSGTPGLATVLRNTGISNAIGCSSSSVKRTFTVTNSNGSLDATIAYTFVPVNELNGLTQSDLKLFNGNTPFAGSVLSGNTLTVSNLSTIAGTYSAAVSAPTITVATTADAVCNASFVQTTDLSYTATTGDVDSYSITWGGAATGQGFTNVTNAAFPASPISITVPANAAANTYTGSLTVKNSSGCTSASYPFILLVKPKLVPSVSIAVTGGGNPTCQGGSITFMATPVNGGTLPTYQWFRSGSPVAGNTSNTYTATNINTSTPVYAVITVGTGVCVTATTATSPTTTVTTKDNSWTGAISTSWNTPGNWCAGTIPTAATNIVIPSGLTRYPVLSNVSSVKDIEIQAGASLTLTNQLFTINGLIEGTGVIKGSASASLTIGSAASGTLYFDAAANLLSVLAANASVTLGNALNVYNLVSTAPSATLNTGGFLTLKSVVSGTASVDKNANITGNVTVERYIPWHGHRAWRLMAIPTGGIQTIKAAWQEGQTGLTNTIPGYGTLLTSTTSTNGYDAVTAGNSLLTLNPGNPGNFIGVPSTNSTIATTGGYMVYIRGDRSAIITGGPIAQSPTTLRTNGPLYQGTQPVINVPANTNKVVGNVYASAIDFALLVRSGISNFKVFDPKIKGTKNVGAYITFSSINGYDPTPSGDSTSYGTTPNSRIESGQAFIVNGETSGGSIQLVEGAKTTGGRNIVFRTNQLIRQFKTNLFAETANGRELADGNAVVFSDDYTNGLDDGDVIKEINPGENLALYSNAMPWVIEGRKNITSSDTIHFSISNLKQQQYSFGFLPKNMDADVTGYLIDSYTGTETSVSMNSPTLFSFKVTGDAASSATNRFSIVFSKDAIVPITSIKVKANTEGRNVKVMWNVSNESATTSQYEIEHSADGNTFSKAGSERAVASGATDLNYSFLHEQAISGNNFYRIKSVGTSREAKYSNVVKVVIGKAAGSFNIYPVPVVNSKINVEFVNQESGKYSISLMNKEGRAIYSTSIIHGGGTATQSLTFPSAIAAGTYQLEIQSDKGLKAIKNLVISNK